MIAAFIAGLFVGGCMGVIGMAMIGVAATLKGEYNATKWEQWCGCDGKGMAHQPGAKGFRCAKPQEAAE